MVEDCTEVSRILAGEGGKRSIRGWLYNKRSSGGILFLIVRDGTGMIQCVLKKDTLDPEAYERINKLPIESVVKIAGMVREDPRAPGSYELLVEDIEVVHEAAGGFPIAKKYHSPDFLLAHRHLWIRSKKMQTILRVRTKLLKVARGWLEEQGYTEVHVPILTAAACEGGSTLFPVDYFGKNVYLTQSWQLYAEAVIASLGKIYTVAPSFRAEKSRTRRHLTEYWHLEVEAPFCDLEGIMKVQEELITHICHTLAKEAYDELTTLGRNPKDLLSTQPPFKKITYDEVIQTLQKNGMGMMWGDDLGWEQEKVLAMRFDQPFFVTHFPKGVKAFYHMPDPKRPRVTLSADLLAPEGYGEIIGGGQRIHDLDELLARIREEGLNPEDYQWYIDLRRYGSVPHAGFGLGIERMVMWVCKLKHIRDAIAFPRLVRRRVYP
ncbi:MAG: Asparagine--tRNA ligase [Candidatus Bathyarchaeota archaeon BA1]|nr:MAG: Asparagine--tRNA ligase [Candidatus Bathyarchaeota archaeon BA1]